MNTVAILFAVCGALLGGALSQEGVCPPPYHYWPHPNCSLFYICNPNGGAHFIDDCPSNLYWNQRVISCDWQYNVPECVGGTQGPLPSTTTMPTPTTTTPTTTTPTTTTPTTTTPTTTTTRPTTTMTTTPSTTMTTTMCAQGRCTQIPSSSTTTTRPTTTSPTTTTPTTTTTTTPTTTTPTTTTPTTPPPTTTLAPGECPPTGTWKLAHPLICDAFWLCVDGVKYDQLFLCPSGLFFDPILQKCNLPSEVDCTPSK